jgi:hypothetical protein
LGFVSFVSILICIGILIKKALAKLNTFTEIERCLVVSYIGGTIGILFNSLFIDVFEASKFAIIFFLMTGLFVSLVRNKLYEDNN